MLPGAAAAAFTRDVLGERVDLPALRGHRPGLGGPPGRPAGPPPRSWAERYSPLHAVAHWSDAERKRAGNYDGKFEEAAVAIEGLLAEAGKVLAPLYLEHYPALVWEDQDECLEVRPEDVEL